MSLTRCVLVSEENASIQLGSNTVRGVLADAVSRELKKLDYPEIDSNDPALLRAISLDLETDKLVAAGFSDKATKAISRQL
jgi:hypothetical protein